MGSISVDTLLAIGSSLGTIALAVWHLHGTIAKQFTDMRRESSEGRAKLYGRMDEIAKETRDSVHRLRAETVSVETFHIANEEVSAQLADMSGRVSMLEQERAGRRQAARV